MTKLKKYMRLKKHILYVEKRVLDLRGEICRQAILYGNVDQDVRQLFLKYNAYLRSLKNPI